jgi:hypothetical protein
VFCNSCLLFVLSVNWSDLLYDSFFTFLQDACVLCKIFQKSGQGPKIGAQYGAPFNEADWNDCNVEYSSCVPSVTPCAPESSHDGLNSAGQHLAVSDVRNVSLGLSSESNGEYVANHAPICPDRTPDVPFDSIHLSLLAEIVSSSMNCLCTACEDGSQVILFLLSYLFISFVLTQLIFFWDFRAAWFNC